MDLPGNYKYSKEHLWSKAENSNTIIGITEHAQAELGDIVFVELPEPGARLTAGETFGSIESVKAISDLIAPVSGEVIKTNERLTAEPQLVNQQPYQEGWLLELQETKETPALNLLDAAAYKGYLG